MAAMRWTAFLAALLLLSAAAVHAQVAAPATDATDVATTTTDPATTATTTTTDPATTTDGATSTDPFTTATTTPVPTVTTPAVGVLSTTDGLINATQCAWNRGVCGASSAAVLATVGSWTNLTAYAVTYLQLATNEVACNQIATADACTANAACYYNDIGLLSSYTTPKCSAVTTGNEDKLKAAAACSGSLVAIANACSKAATPDACSATNSKCAWTEGVCHHADLPTSLAGSVASALTGLQSKVDAFDASVWGNCDSFKVFQSLLTVCGPQGLSTNLLNEDQCNARAPACTFSITCAPTPVATLQAFGAVANTPLYETAKACRALTSQAACEAPESKRVNVTSAIYTAAKAGTLKTAAQSASLGRSPNLFFAGAFASVLFAALL